LKLFNTPMMMPLTPKMTVLTSIQRIKSAVRACCAGLKPGASKFATNHGAAAAVAIVTAVSNISTRLVTALKTRHAPVRSRRATQPANTGMNAEPSAPPAMSWNSRSGTRNAARYASRSALVPKRALMIISRARPAIRLRKNRAITSVAARRMRRLMPAVLVLPDVPVLAGDVLVRGGRMGRIIS
jgi:hypothetical protein